MTNQNIITSVKLFMDDDELSDTKITLAANWVQNDLFNNNSLRIAQESTQIKGNLGALDLDLPDDFHRITTLYLTSPQTYDLTDDFIDYDIFMRRFANFATATAAQARNYTFYGNAVRFGAPLNAVHSFQLDYLRNPVDMISPSDDCEIPNNYSEMMTRLTIARMMEMAEDYDYAQQERQLASDQVTAFIRNEAVGMIRKGPVIMKTGRRKHNDW